MAIKMADIAKQKHRDMATGKGAWYAESAQQYNRRARLGDADMAGLQAHAGQFTQPTAAHDLLNGAVTSHLGGGAFMPRLDSNRARKGLTDLVVLESMAAVNLKMRSREMDDLRQHVLQSAQLAAGSDTQQNRAVNAKLELNNELLWASDARFAKGKSMSVLNYARAAQNTRIQGPKDHSMYGFEAYKHSSHVGDQRRGNLDNPSMYGFDAMRHDNTYGPEVAQAHLVGPMGSKYTRGYIDSTIGQNDLNDLSALNSRA
jgi:hypothetical protein